MTPCPHNCYAFTQTASTSSAFAGVLAVFAFFAIVCLLERARHDRRERAGGRDGTQEGPVLSALAVAFAGLLIATFLYGGVTGEARIDHRAALAVRRSSARVHEHRRGNPASVRAS